MNPVSNVSQVPLQTHTYLIRLDPTSSRTGINSSDVVVPLHILEADINPQLMVPYVQLNKPTFQLQTGAGKTLNILKKKKPTTIESIQSSQCFVNTKSSIVNMNSAAHFKSKPVPNNVQTEGQLTFFSEAIPNVSKQYAINDEIEFLHPLNFAPSIEQEDLPTPNEISNFPNSEQYDLRFAQPNGNQNDEVQVKDTLINDPQIYLEPINSYMQLPLLQNEKKVQNEKRNTKLKNVYKRRMPQNYVHMSDVKVPPRAVAVLPTPLLIRGNNICPKRSLPSRIRFGPVEGIRKVITQSEAKELASTTDAPVFLIKEDNDIIHIDVSDKDKCNWMGLLPLGDKESSANVWLYQENDQLYGITTEPMIARRYLRLGYSKKYGEQHQLPPEAPTLDLETILSVNPKRWWCNECNRALPSALLLQHHTDVYHKDEPVSKCRMGYRCNNCRRSFTRLFSLRRHRYKYCLKKPVKPPLIVADKPSTILDLNSTLNNEENRLPSDESFQNFANGLDFSASLFDSDRISNLDISGNSRPDDFSYGFSFRDDNEDLSFPKLTNSPNMVKSKKVNEETLFDTSFCSQIVAKKKRKLKSISPSKKLECACGHKFTNKTKLALHISQEHPVDASTTKEKLPEDVKEYKCDQCNLDFKRRGMLVNHLWRMHKVVSTAPMTRPVRHYPCVACLKIYRSAAKRNRHIEVNHPGVEKLSAQSIKGGVRSCVPATCTECPRQYATRAKLLQHVRTKHPNSEMAKSNPPRSTTEAITGQDKNVVQQISSQAHAAFGYNIR